MKYRTWVFTASSTAVLVLLLVWYSSNRPSNVLSKPVRRFPYVEGRNSATWHEFLKSQTLPKQHGNQNPLSFCKDINSKSGASQELLNRLSNGKWVPRSSVSEEDKKEVNDYYHVMRSYFGVPDNLSRSDGFCGNVSFVSPPPRFWFRVLCDKSSDKPCCYENVCAPKTVKQCQCEDCYDSRGRVDPELADWLPSKNYKLEDFSTEAACSFLTAKYDNVVFMGDSLMCHFYAAMLLLLRNDPINGVLYEDAPQAARQICSKRYLQFLHPECLREMARKAIVCQGQLKMEMVESNTVGFVNWGLNYFNSELQNLNRTFFAFGVGIHDNFTIPRILKGYIKPFLKLVKLKENSNHSVPSFLWVNPHLPGLLLTPRVPERGSKYAIRYSNYMDAFFRDLCIPVMNNLHLTKNVVSWDGVHYGYAVNMIKAKILLNYLHLQTVER